MQGCYKILYLDKEVHNAQITSDIYKNSYSACTVSQKTPALS